jgi:hypothetical protein
MSYATVLISCWCATALGLWRGDDPKVNICLGLGASVALFLHWTLGKIFAPTVRR